MAKKGFDPNIGKNTQFGNGQDATRGGRPKKIYTILKDKGFSKDDTKAVFGELAFYTVKELEEVLEDTTKPVIMTVVARAFMAAAADGDYRMIKEIMEQFIGKALTNVAVEAKVDTKVEIEFQEDIGL